KLQWPDAPHLPASDGSGNLRAQDFGKLTGEIARGAVVEMRAVGAGEMCQGRDIGKMNRCGAGLLRDLVVEGGAREQLFFDLANAAAAGEDDVDHLAAV